MRKQNDLIGEFMTYCRITKNLSSKTLIAYSSDLNCFNNYIKTFKNADVYDYISYLQKSRLKTATIRRHISSLSQYHKYIYMYNKSENPMLHLSFKLKSEKRLPKTLTIDEIKKLFATLYKIKNKANLSEFQRFQIIRDIAILDLLCSTGIRIGEAAAITLEDMDLKTGMIHGKGKKERIAILSCKTTINNLKEWLYIRKKYNVRNNLLFSTHFLKPISARNIEDIFNKYKKLSKINPYATAHYLRHTFATNLLANGADLRTVQELMGHSTISVTEIYTEVTTKQKIKILKKYNYRNYI